MHPESYQPCHSKLLQWLFATRVGFFLLCVCTDLGNKSLALVAAQGHTRQCDQYYQIVTKINLESLRLQLPGKVF